MNNNRTVHDNPVLEETEASSSRHVNQLFFVHRHFDCDDRRRTLPDSDDCCHHISKLNESQAVTIHSLRQELKTKSTEIARLRVRVDTLTNEADSLQEYKAMYEEMAERMCILQEIQEDLRRFTLLSTSGGVTRSTLEATATSTPKIEPDDVDENEEGVLLGRQSSTSKYREEDNKKTKQLHSSSMAMPLMATIERRLFAVSGTIPAQQKQSPTVEAAKASRRESSQLPQQPWYGKPSNEDDSISTASITSQSAGSSSIGTGGTAASHCLSSLTSAIWSSLVSHKSGGESSLSLLAIDHHGASSAASDSNDSGGLPPNQGGYGDIWEQSSRGGANFIELNDMSCSSKTLLSSSSSITDKSCVGDGSHLAGLVGSSTCSNKSLLSAASQISDKVAASGNSNSINNEHEEDKREDKTCFLSCDQVCKGADNEEGKDVDDPLPQNTTAPGSNNTSVGVTNCREEGEEIQPSGIQEPSSRWGMDEPPPQVLRGSLRSSLRHSSSYSASSLVPPPGARRRSTERDVENFMKSLGEIMYDEEIFVTLAADEEDHQHYDDKR